MPVTREVRYLSPNDLGKYLRYEVLFEGEKQTRGGLLESMETEVEWIANESLCSQEAEREMGRVSVLLTISGDLVRFGIHDPVTLTGGGS